MSNVCIYFKGCIMEKVVNYEDLYISKIVVLVFIIVICII